MPVTRYRSIEEMSRPWRDAHSPENLRLVARMLAIYRCFAKGTPRQPGVRRFTSLQEAKAGGSDPYRS